MNPFPSESIMSKITFKSKFSCFMIRLASIKLFLNENSLLKTSARSSKVDSEIS
jgi:hypothetical protein